MVPKTAKVEMARRLSKFRVLRFRVRNPDGIVEHYARNPSPALALASAKRTRGTDFLFCNGLRVCNSFMGDLEG
jgi:hypothetical protein